MKSEPILRWREVALAILLPLCIGGIGRYAWVRSQKSAAVAAEARKRQADADADAALKADITLAISLDGKGNFGAAEPILRRALATREKKSGRPLSPRSPRSG